MAEERDPKDTTETKDQHSESKSSGEGTDQKYTITVNGKQLQCTLDELKEYAQKAEAADEKFREAAQDRKFREDVKAARLGDATALRRVAKELGWSEEELLGAANKASRGDRNPSPPSTGGGNADDLDLSDPQIAAFAEYITDAAVKRLKLEQGRGKKPVGLDDLAPDIQAAIRRTYGNDVENHLKNSIDKDPVLRDHIRDSDEKQADFIRGLVRQSVAGRMKGQEDAWSDATVRGALQEVRQYLDDIGFIPRKSKSRAPHVGLGPSTPTPGGSPTFDPQKKLVRPKGGTASAEHEEYILNKLAQAMMEDE